MTKNRVSVVIPTRDNLDVLPKALQSVRSQNICEIEIIIADDGSTDGTGAWLAEQKKTEPRLRVIKTGGKGPANARNQAISIAKAPLVAFLDSDDWWSPGKLKWQVAYHEKHPDVGFSFTDYLAIDTSDKTYGTCFEYWKPHYGNRPPQGYTLLEDAESELLGCNTAGTSTIVARTGLLQIANGFATDLPSAEDWDLWLKLAALAPVACTSIIGTSYLMRPNSESARREERLDAMNSIIDRYRTHQSPSFRAAVRKADARIFTARADIARLDGNYWGAVAAELHALIKAPNMRDARAAASDAAQGVRKLIESATSKRPPINRAAA